MSIEAVNWAFKQDIKPTAKKFVLVALADCSDDYGIAFPSYNHIAKKTGMTKRAVMQNMKLLELDNIIEIAGRIRANTSHTSNAYKIMLSEQPIGDHPLGALFKSEGVNDIHHPSEAYSPPSEAYSPPSEAYSPLEPSINHQLTKKKKKALTRDEFMREIDYSIKHGDFKRDFPHLSDIELATEASPTWDWCEANLGEVLEGGASVRLRMWVRKGIKQGAIRSKEQAEQNVCKGSEYKQPENPLQAWQKKLISEFSSPAFRSWIRPLWHDDHGNLCAPNQFIADRVKEQYADQIRPHFNFDQIIVKQYQPKGELEHA